MRNLVSTVSHISPISKVRSGNTFLDKITRFVPFIFVFSFSAYLFICFLPRPGTAAERPDAAARLKNTKNTPKKPPEKKALRQGGAANQRKMERDVLLHPALEAKSTLDPGATRDANDLLLKFSPKALSGEASAETKGGYLKVADLISRLQRIKEDLAFYLGLPGRLALYHLGSSEKFLPVASYGLRSYFVNESSGNKLNTVNAKLRFTIPKLIEIPIGNFQFFGFVDAGQSWIKRDSWRVAGEENRRDLPGLGIGLNWGTPHVSVRTSYAWKPESEKEISDKDRSGRFWLQTVIWF